MSGISKSRLMGRLAGLAGLIFLAFAPPALAGGPQAGGPQAGGPQAPFGDQVSAQIFRYNRAAPGMASAGRLTGDGVAEAKSLSFKTIVDLRTPREGLEAERKAAAAAGLSYINIPVSGGVPTASQVARFAAIADDPANHPILFHCQGANRAGAMWALYRTLKGVPAAVALDEGRTAGLMPFTEIKVRAQLGLPAQSW